DSARVRSRVGRARTRAISEATKKAFTSTSTTATVMFHPTLVTGSAASQEALVLWIALEAVEHRVGGQPSGHLRLVRRASLLQPPQRFRLLPPQGVERRQVVVQQQIVRVESPGLDVGSLRLGVEALLGVADPQIQVGLEVLRLEPHHLLQLGDGAPVI